MWFWYESGHGLQDVHAALAEIISDNLGVSKEEATKKIKAMQEQGRYVRDIWS